MITYEKLLKKPQVAKSLIGMALVEFDKFYVEFETAHTEWLQSSKKTRGKKKAHTLKNQAAISPTGLVEHASESVPGSTHDLTVLRQTGLLSELADDEAAMMDKGYDGMAADYPDKKLYLPFKARRNHPLTEEQKAYNRFLAKDRIVVEHTMAQLNKFQILAQRFRHQLAKHSVIFRIVCGLVHRRIQLRPLKQYSPA